MSPAGRVPAFFLQAAWRPGWASDLRARARGRFGAIDTVLGLCAALGVPTMSACLDDLGPAQGRGRGPRPGAAEVEGGVSSPVCERPDELGVVPPIPLRQRGTVVGQMPPPGDYVWIGLEEVVMTERTRPGETARELPESVAPLAGGRVLAEDERGDVVSPVYEALVEASAHRGGADGDDTPVVLVLDDRVPVETVGKVLYTALRANRWKQFVFSGTSTKPRVVPIDHLPFCGAGSGIDRFEADLSLTVYVDRVFVTGHAREAGAPPHRGSPSSARVTTSLPIDVDGHGECSLPWPPDGRVVRRIEADLCRVSEGRPYGLTLEMADPATMRAGQLVQMIVALDLRPRSCRSPVTLAWNSTDAPPSPDRCLRARAVKAHRRWTSWRDSALMKPEMGGASVTFEDETGTLKFVSGADLPTSLQLRAGTVGEVLQQVAVAFHVSITDGPGGKYYLVTPDPPFPPPPPTAWTRLQALLGLYREPGPPMLSIDVHVERGGSVRCPKQDRGFVLSEGDKVFVATEALLC